MRHLLTGIATMAVGAAAAFALTPEETMDFLYSGMSLPDRADYTEEFYRSNVDAALRARAEMPWGDSVPDREFLHFVVPVRVNNENLDDSRIKFYEELRPRVAHLAMKDAILEVNHWCHEKVTYRPSDARTSSPLSSVSQAIGRCGEESTFTVAALRSVGIPARQIYTPRWAHTDDNHAWVEAWADGKWHFIGACEPEPIPDLAWFNDPASRGLLMSTNVWGDYQGPEEVLLKQPLTTRINVTPNYAPTATLPVRVVYPDGTPAAGAKVNFCIYNYAEYYPAVTKTADSRGEASLTAGLGDMTIWATDGTTFGLAKGNAAECADGGVIEVVLDKDSRYRGVVEFDLIPPAAGAKLPTPTPEQRAANDRRLQLEDSIRNAYTSTFATEADARNLARSLDLDEADMVKILTESRGNHENIARMLALLDPKERGRAVALLLNVSEKDRRDLPMEVVGDQLQAFTPDDDATDANDSEYLLNPRVELEYLRPWRKTLSETFAPYAKGYRENPELLAAWVRDNIADASADNPQQLRMSPAAVLKERKADPLSRGIFFVAAARSIGIPARIDPVTGAVQYLDSRNEWHTVLDDKVDNANHDNADKGFLTLTFSPSGRIVDPTYYSQFSISRIDNGMPRQLEFDEDGTLSTLFADPCPLQAGQYVLTTGRRLANGGVLARSEFFVVTPGDTVSIPVAIREDDTRLSVIGSLNAENIYHDIAGDADKSLLSTTGRGFYILGLIRRPNHEPSAHALNDISAVADRLEATGKKIMLLFDDESNAARFSREAFPGLPSNVVFGIDTDGATRKEIVESLHLENPGDPLFVLADTFNRIVWVSSGYTIGLGEQLLNLKTD